MTIKNKTNQGLAEESLLAIEHLNDARRVRGQVREERAQARHDDGHQAAHEANGRVDLLAEANSTTQNETQNIAAADVVGHAACVVRRGPQGHSVFKMRGGEGETRVLKRQIQGGI